MYSTFHPFSKLHISYLLISTTVTLSVSRLLLNNTGRKVIVKLTIIYVGFNQANGNWVKNSSLAYKTSFLNEIQIG